MKRAIVLVAGLFLVMASMSVGASPQKQAAASAGPATASAQSAVLDRYCVKCHNDRLASGSLVLAGLDLERVGENAPLWEKVTRKLRAGLMPPAGQPRPDPATYNGVLSWLEKELDRSAAAHPNPGRPEGLHRLNRVEYRNAVRDLMAVDLDLTEVLPADTGSYGFDNMAGALKMNEMQMERYLAAAQRIAIVAVGTPPLSMSGDVYRTSRDALQYQHVKGLPLGTRGGLVVDHNFPQDGEYNFKIELLCGLSFQEGDCDGSGGFDDTHQLQFLIDDEVAKEWSLPPRDYGSRTPGGWVVRIPVKGGPRKVGVTFVALPRANEVEGHRLRNERPMWASVSVVLQAAAPYQPAVGAIEITGPYQPTGIGETPSRRRLFTCRPATAAEELGCAKTIISKVARRAYRGKATDDDVQMLLTFYKQGREEGNFEKGIEMAIRRVLVSPKFLFRVEEDPVNAAADANYRISDVDLASRLSFFLWSSIPDDELLDAATQNKLRDSKVLDHHVRRMLADPRSVALTKNFAGQWLLLRNVAFQQPQQFLFPDFDDSLRAAMVTETELFFDSVVREDRSAMDLLTADYTFVNERLAKHYDIPNVTGSQFRRVTYPNERRRGILGHGSVLLITSHAVRTSPVIRGKYILTNILGTPPPPPPPNVPPFEEREKGKKEADSSVRERMAKHRANPVCATCHSMIDPAGFALENFDAVGKWRDLEEGRPIDASGVLPDGTKFGNGAEFQRALAQHPERFILTLAERLLTYGLGRGTEYYDMPAIRAVTRQAGDGNYRFSSIVIGIVKSLPFQSRRTVAAKLPGNV